ncbi:cellulose biosynthesis protein BcsQ [Dysgonomonas sp. PFB1-18]|uniref:ParA family protein n=1 Tax=unclassified Dysgonomonas TaxID=2630389 RepID=UPI0024768A1D|nr:MULTISPECIES: ParA family protein [unclassified Dysgonomonas]MDH6310959.1 cellulose biosynthesis protein BcsQ [Dysgonomonas sp. PF1-14]MDH6340826.1 cellulose biosynthesis protein BcsQ [Dysgonomonas sp. PF1-16]MDH6382482.1 cellulose biosynthesis protein BcsQ [Dysgonomonas sp. PFB1-18]MDH6399831.1 cellulose biosynthesis protein BcsQ [Dysgonomonas sp. PF1-23]
MKKETLFIAIGNQKGGVGKSTITATIASYLQYQMNMSVAIIDCDFPQYSIYKMRETDIETINKNKDLQVLLQKQFHNSNKKAYPIIAGTPENAIDLAVELTENSATTFDIVFFDLPGNVTSEGILKLMFNLNYIFVPIIADKRVLQSSLSFILAVKEFLGRKDINKRLNDVFIFWNKVDRRESTELYSMFNKVLKSENLSVLKTIIPDAKKYNKELSILKPTAFRSTLFAPDKKMLKGSNLEELVLEIIEKIGL